MRRWLFALSAPWRLALAVRRNGLGPVVSFLVLNLRRRGIGGALYMALADRCERAERMEIEAARPAAERRSGPPDLDDDFAISNARWEKWAAWVGAPEAAADAHMAKVEPAALLYLVRGAAVDREAFALTRRAIGRGDHLQVLEVEEGAAPELPPGPPGRFVVFLRAGDAPRPEFAVEIARAARGGVAEVVSFDLTRHERGLVFPILVPGANPTLLRAVDYLFGRVVLWGSVIEGVEKVAVADPRTLILEWMGRHEPMQVRGRWRHAGRPLVDTAIGAETIVAQVQLAQTGMRRSPPKTDRRASVVICTKDRGHLLRQLVRNLLAGQSQVVAEVVIVSNGSTNPYALRTLEDLADDPRVRIVHDDGGFNFSRLANTGARTGGAGSHLLFLNDDIVPVTEDWIERLLARFDDPAAGAVGPLLLYPDERVQHAGMYLGFDGIAGHMLRHAALPEQDYLFTSSAPREATAVTGAVLMVSRAAFEAVNGFDGQLATFLQDVDLCLRLQRSGFVNIFDPSAVLIHMESVSIRPLEMRAPFQTQRLAERARFLERWGPVLQRDPYHPAGFDLQDPSLRSLAAAGGRRPAVRNGAPIGPPAAGLNH